LATATLSSGVPGLAAIRTVTRIGIVACAGASGAAVVQETVGGAATQCQPTAFTCWKTMPGGRLSTTEIGSLVGALPVLVTVMR